jgi:hypothetical protein
MVDVEDEQESRLRQWCGRIPYTLLCVVLGLAMGWLPKLVHGPIPEKFDYYFLNGSVIVWAFYSSRLLIGFWVGAGTWPPRWYLRGPLYGLLTMLPVTLVALGVPNCGFT